MRRVLTVAVAGLVLGASATVWRSPAANAAAPRLGYTADGSAVLYTGTPSAPALPLLSQTSSTFAGFRPDVPPVTPLTVAGTFTVGRFSCPASGAFSVLVEGVWLNAGNTGEGGGVSAICSDGVLGLSPLWIVAGQTRQNGSYAVSSGDTISVSISVVGSPAESSVMVKDLTNGNSFTDAGPTPGLTPVWAGFQEDAGWSSPAKTSLLPIPTFGSITFTACSVDGVPMGAFLAPATSMVSGSTVQIATSEPTATMDGFSTVFEHN